MASLTEPKPNILLITTDQQRHDTCGPRAPSFMRTPHFDHLTREGITFSRTYADCPICVPSRVQIMTGKSVFHHRMFGNGQSSRAMGHDDTLPAMLRPLGYQCVAIGKMHFTPQRNRHGFDEMLLPEDYYLQMDRSGYPLKPMHHGLGQNELYPGMATVPEALTLTSWTAEQCVQFIRERRDPSMPFFLWCSFSKPHPPLDPPEPYYSMYRDCPIPDPVYGDWSDDEHAPEAFKRFRQQWSLDQIPPEVIRAARAAYYGLITQIDYNMGRVFAALQDMAMFNDTLILYCSDHGEYLGDHHSGAKMYFHEPSAHVPMVLRLPTTWSDRRSGTVCEQVTSLADIVPTLVRAAGGTAAEGVTGQDLVATARGELSDARSFIVSTVGAPAHCASLGITDGRWKYIWWPEGAAEQLFDLEADPDECRNLAGQQACAERQRALREQMTRWLAAHSPAHLEEGGLPRRTVQGDTVAERRARPWPGYHTEYYDVDVRH